MYKLIVAAHNTRKTRQYDGIYKKNNTFIILTVHGHNDGKLLMEWNDNTIYIRPCQLRATIQYLTGITIPLNKTIKIIPCFPLQVKIRYSKELQKNNIKIIGNWSESTNLMITEHNNNIVTLQAVNATNKDKRVNI